MGNAIKHLKRKISEIPPEQAESVVGGWEGRSEGGKEGGKIYHVFTFNFMYVGVYLSFNYTSSSFCFFWSQSKRELCQMLDDYIDLRVRRADDEISASCQKIIKNKDDVILVYA